MTSSSLRHGLVWEAFSHSPGFLAKEKRGRFPARPSFLVLVWFFFFVLPFFSPYVHVKNPLQPGENHRQGKEGAPAQSWRPLPNRRRTLSDRRAFGGNSQHRAWQTIRLLPHRSPSRGQRVLTPPSGSWTPPGSQTPKSSALPQQDFRSVNPFLVPALSKRSGASVLFDSENVTVDRCFPCRQNHLHSKYLGLDL